MGNLGLTEILLILFILVLLFGGKKIPELAKGLGEGVKAFKKGLKGENDKNTTDENKDKNWAAVNSLIF